MLGGLGSWVLGLGAWAWGLEFGVEMWRFADMVVDVAVVGRSWDLVARMGVGVGLGEWDLVGLVEGLSRFAGGIFLLRRCLCASGWFLVVVQMMVVVEPEAGMFLRVVVVADRTTSLMVC